MKSYIKTQWGSLLIALCFFGMTCFYILRPAGDLTTLEGLNYDFENAINAGVNFSNFIFWFFFSVIGWQVDCTRELEKRITALEKELKEVKK